MDTLEYEVVEHNQISENTLQEMYYSNQNGRFIRRYQKSCLMFPHLISQLETNYNSYLVEEFKPNSRSLDAFQTALLWIASEFQKRNIRWWLAGSAALCVRGLALLPHDIDIMTFKSEIEGIHTLIEPYIVEPFHHVTGWVVKGFGVINYHFRIDIAFESEEWVDGQGPVDFGPYAQNHLETILWHGFPIQVPPIKLNLASNLARGRDDRVALIQQYLQKNQS